MCTRHDPAQEGPGALENKTCFPTRKRTDIDPFYCGQANDRNCLQTSDLAAQTDNFTRIIHPHGVPMKAEAKTPDTTGEMNGKYERVPHHGGSHW